MSEDYTRVTLAGERRNVEMLLPSQRAIGELVPEVLELMGPDHGTDAPGALTLTPLGSASLSAQQTLADAGVSDGAVLALDRRDESVPAPVVYDLAEDVATQPRSTHDTWILDAGRLTGGTLTTITVTAALVLAVTTFDPSQPGWWTLGVAAGLLVILAAVPQSVLNCDVELITPSGIAVALAVFWGLPEGLSTVWIVSGWIVAALSARLCSRRSWQGLVITTATAAVLGLLWWAGPVLVEQELTAAGIAAVGTALLLGLVPRLALTLSGMNTIDDAITTGRRPSTTAAASALRGAHAGLAAAVLLLALSAVLSVQRLLSEGLEVWSGFLAGALVLLTGLRARSMPLAVERAALVGAATLGAVLMLGAAGAAVPGWLPPALLVVLAAGVLGLRTITVADHVAARLRVTARRLETLSTITLIPLLIGISGLFSQLAGTFQD